MTDESTSPKPVLAGKSIVVCGAGPGLGAEIAKLALRDGASVTLAARNADRLTEMATTLDPAGERVQAITTDVSDQASCNALAAAVTDRFGRLDGWAQVAALDAAMGDFDAATDDQFRDCFEINVVGTVHAVRAAAPHMAASGGGSVVLIGSQAQLLPAKQMRQVAYATSKSALTALMYNLAQDLGADKIRVNQVLPTWMWGPPVEGYVAWQASERDVDPAEIVAEITAAMPLGTEVPADDDVAEAVVFFMSDRARMITGQSLLVNAGEHMP